MIILVRLCIFIPVHLYLSSYILSEIQENTILSCRLTSEMYV